MPSRWTIRRLNRRGFLRVVPRGADHAFLNEMWDFRRLAASIERHAGGGEAAVFGGNVYGGRWFSIDFYARRPLDLIQTIGEFNAYIARADRPIVVVRGPIWRLIQPETRPGVRILEQVTVGGQNLLIVRGG